MARNDPDSRILNHFVPTLLHASVVKFSLSLLNNFSVRMLDRAFAEIQCWSFTASNQCNQEHCKVKCNIAEEHNTKIQQRNLIESDKSNRENVQIRSKRESEANRGIHDGKTTAPNKSEQENGKARLKGAKERNMTAFNAVSQKRGKVRCKSPNCLEIQNRNKRVSCESRQEIAEVGCNRGKEQSTEIQLQYLTAPNRSSQENGKIRYKRAKKNSAEIQREYLSTSKETNQENNVRYNRDNTEIQHEYLTASNESSQENIQIRDNRGKEQSKEIQHEYLTPPIEVGEENGNIIYDRAKESLLLIPGCLRQRVMETVHGLDYTIRNWQMDHLFVGRNKCTFHWRSEGTIDAVKTARQLVLDESLNIWNRFLLACIYCFEDDILTLWAEMVKSGQTGNFTLADNSTVRFWIRWMLGDSDIHWSQAAVEYLNFPRQHFRTPMIKFSSLFPLLQPKERRRFLYFLGFTTDEDFRVSLLTVTKGEEDKILKISAKKLLLLHLNWPLQSIFIETVTKMWTYVDIHTFIFLAKKILLYCSLRKDFDYCDLFEQFWNDSPIHFRKTARECPALSQRIDSCLSERRKRRNAVTHRMHQLLSQGSDKTEVDLKCDNL